METKSIAVKRGWIVTAIALMVLTVCLAAATAFALSYNNKNMQATERTHEQNLYELGDNLNNLEVNLSKLMIAPDGEFTATLLTDVYSEAQAAEKALASLPLDWHSSENAAGFLNQLADFSVSYQRALIGGNSGRKYAECLEDMYIATRQLNAAIGDAVSLVSQNKMNINKLTANRPFTFRRTETDFVQHNAVEYPELIYDGPFSDGRADDCYKYFDGCEEVSLKEAKEIAKKALEQYGVKSVASEGKSDKEPLYELSVACERSEAYVSVSAHGGKIVNLTVTRPLGAVMLGETSAKACAKEFAASLGYEVEPVWYQTAGGVAYVNLAPVKDDVVFYTDLVKVKVALDNGEALGLEAKNYCLNHTDRDTTLRLNRNAVPTLVDERLTVKLVRGAMIPLENGKERLCYEVAAEYKGLDYFVYLDAETGSTVKIMRTVDTDQGSLVM